MSLVIAVLVIVCIALIADGRRHCRLIREGRRPRQ